MKTVGFIPSAGIASRLFPQTKSMNKLMMPLAGRPVVDYLIQEFVDSGIEEVYITGRNLDQIKGYFFKDQKLYDFSKEYGHTGSLDRLNKSLKNIKIHYITQNTPKGWLAELKKVSQLSHTANIAMSFSDIVYVADKPVISQLIDKNEKVGKTVSCNGRYLFDSNARVNISKLGSIKSEKDARNENSFLAKLRKESNLEHFQADGVSYDVGDWISWIKSNTSFALQSSEFGDDYLQFLNDRLA